MTESSTFSGERLSYYKLFRNKQYKVEIPIIQRDYAQGRTSEREVRDGFLDALYDYLDQGKANRDLDFVYGSINISGERPLFVPLDGQQRLTTLFLLHWYLAQISNNADQFRSVVTSNQRSLFSYETRSSSREFCDSLMACDIDIVEITNNGNSVSNLIKDKGWFYLSWENDPTIQSMLVMLDSIHAKFCSRPEFFEKLIDEDYPVVTFLFLDLHEFKLTDDLYIKMNARGKPLTGFENFKAKLEQHIKSFSGEWPDYKLKHSENKVDGHEYFIHKIDTDWTDIFWAYRNKRNESGIFDDELMNYIALIITNFILVNEDESNADIDVFMGHGGKVKILSFHDYHDFGCLTKTLIIHLIERLDLLYNGGLKADCLNTYLNANYYYSEEAHFQSVIENSSTYPEKLRFHAFYTYLATEKPKEELAAWMRIVFNLTENTVINTADEYERALISIDKLGKIEQPILDAFIDDCNIAFFSSWQVFEEKIKACLIKKSTKWNELIIKAEKHSFFKGQIGFALKFSKILDYYRDNNSCEWSDDEDKEYFNAVEHYVKSAENIFDFIGRSSGAIDYLWERAVLSKGVYFTETSASRMNLLSTRQRKNNIDRDHSWKRLLRISARPDAEWDERQEYVKAVFDDILFNKDKIKDSLQAICNKALKNEEIEDWRKAFIKYPVLYTECNQGFIAKNYSGIFLFSESQRNHYHSELFSRILEIELDSDRISPFPLIRYEKVKTQEVLPSLKIRGWMYKDDYYSVEIWFDSNQYHQLFYKSGTDEYPEELIPVLDANKYKSTDEFDGISFIYKSKKAQKTIRKLYDLCLDLQGLTGE